MESLAPEIAPFGIHTTIVNPGFFRTELLSPESTTFAELSIEDYAERTRTQNEWWKAQHHHQSGDPAKLAQAILSMVSQAQPPSRFLAGADVISIAEQKAAALQEQANHDRELILTLAYDGA
jgi:NAD(P)-dependent dehydrogenase (short-subunit alcohol dehydrogenase family)